MPTGASISYKDNQLTLPTNYATTSRDKLAVLPSRSLKEKEFLLAVDTEEIQLFIERNPSFQYSKALNCAFRYLPALEAYELYAIPRMNHSDAAIVSIRKWNMSSEDRMETIFTSVYKVTSQKEVTYYESIN